MPVTDTNEFTEDEKDILQEIMNIAFGSATADLAEVIDIFVELSVPDIKLIDTKDLPDFIKETIHTYGDTSIIDQKFWGDFAGSSLLVFPTGGARELVDMLIDNASYGSMEKPMVSLERESLIEIGNILIGACIGKISDLLDTFATYSPPRLINDVTNGYESYVESYDPSSKAILMKTLFKFEQKDLTGLLLILTSQKSIGWLKKALLAFMEQYE